MTDAPFSLPASLRFVDRPPLRVETGLAGHLVVALYWRLGCAHSRAALDEVLAAAAAAGRGVVVLLVHVPRHDAERDDDRVRRALHGAPTRAVLAVADPRDGPVGVERLPTLALVDDRGTCRARAVGVPRRGRLRDAITALRDEADDAGRLAAVPFAPLVAAQPRLGPTAVVVADERVWVASAAHRRVFAFDRSGELVATFGSGAWGDVDGPADEACFARPAALCAHDGGDIVVADAATHTLRVVDVAAGEVRTWCGTGRFGADAVGGGYGTDQALSQPAGVVSRDGGVYVCQAATDQLWQVDPMTGAAMAWLGGEYGGRTFHQPLAIADDADSLWVAEGGGALARVDLAHVERHEARRGFARPVAVVVAGDTVWVADAYRGELVALDAADPAGAPRRVLGAADGLREPAALAVDGERLFLADAAADGLLTLDLRDPDAAPTPWPLRGLPALRTEPRGARLARPVTFGEHSDVVLRVPAPGLADGATAAVDVVDEAAATLACARDAVVTAEGEALDVLLPIAEPNEGALRVRVRTDAGEARYVVPVRVIAGGPQAAALEPADG